MDSFSIVHWLLMLALMVALAVAIVAIAWVAQRRREPPPRGTNESRLRELQDLHAKGLLDLAEYERQRAQILRGL